MLKRIIIASFILTIALRLNIAFAQASDEFATLQEYLDEVDKAIETNPKDAGLCIQRGLILRKLGRPEEAIKAYGQAVKKDSTLAPLAWNNKGVVLEDLGELERAISAYDSAIHIYSDFRLAWKNKAVVLDKIGRYEKALAAYDKATELGPEDFQAWTAKGMVLRKLGRHQKALEAHKKALEINPSYMPAMNNKGVVLEEQGKFEQAISAYDSAIQMDSTFRLAWKNKARLLEKRGSYEEALGAYEKATELGPEDAQAWYSMGLVLASLGRYEEAAKVYRRATEVTPTEAEAWYNKGVALANLPEPKYRAAIEAYETVLELNPKYAEAWYGKAICLFELAQPESTQTYEEALRAFEKALEIWPGHAYAWLGTGVTLAHLGRYEEAMKALERVTKLNPNSALGHINLGLLLLNLGKLERATAKVADALEIDSVYIPALRLKGKIAIEEQKHDEAFGCFKKAILLDGGDPLLFLWAAYARYLAAEFSSDTEDWSYQQKIHSIITDLRRAEELSKKQGTQETRGHILYFLGYFYYKANDMFTAKQKLEECVNTQSSIESSAYELVNYLWDYQIRVPLWRWWVDSPIHAVRVMFFVLIVVIVCIFSLLLVHPFIQEPFYRFRINWTLYIFCLVLLIILCISPRIERIRAKDIDVELGTPPSFQFTVPPPTMGAILEQLDRPLQDATIDVMKSVGAIHESPLLKLD